MQPAVADRRHVRWHAAHSHRGDLVAQGISRGLSRQDAEDVASESILRAAAKDDLDVDRAGGWLRIVAHHLAVDLHRSAPSERVRQRLQHASVDFVEPQTAIDDRLEAEWVASVVEGLPDRQRRALHYRAAGFTVEEIAERMGSSYKTVESLISRARSAVRKAIGATLGLLGLLLSGQRRGLGSSAASVAVVVSFTVWCAIGQGPGARGSEPGAEPFATAVLRTAPQHETAPLQASGSRASASVPAVAIGSTSSARVLAPGKAGPVKHGGASVTRSRQNESLVTSVQRCLANGVALDPEHIGCQ